MSNVKDENAITLAILVITIIILAIIASVSISAGKVSLDNTRLRNFYLKLEIVQKRVDNIVTQNEKYTDKYGNEIILKETGVQLTDAQKDFLSKTVGIEDVSYFKYFTEKDLEQYFDLTDIGHNVFIDFENRRIVSEDAVIANRKEHYVLENNTYFVKNSNINKNVGKLNEFKISGEIYGTQTYKIRVTPPSNIGDIRRKWNDSIQKK